MSLGTVKFSGNNPRFYNQILDQWQKFVNAKTQLEAQIEVKNLLEMLVNKITY